MTYPINDVPCAFGTPDGFFNKTNKATIVHHLSDDHLTQDPQTTSDNDIFYIEDGNAFFHSMTNIPNTFKEIGLKILDSTAHKKNVIFSTDDYHENSIKSLELKRRAGEAEHEVLVLSGENMKRPLDFKLFLQTGVNKIAFCKLLLQIFRADYTVKRLAGRNFVFVVQGKVYQLDSDGISTHVTELKQFYSNQEETDSRIIVYLKLVASVNEKGTVIIRSPDSDVFILLLYYSNKFTLRLLLDTGSGDSRRLIDISELGKDIGEDLCKALLGFYVFTGEDTNAAFRGMGKVRPYKKLLANPKYLRTFRKLGKHWEVASDLYKELEEFCCIMYNTPRTKSIDTVRYMKLKAMVGKSKKLTMKKIDITRLPPPSRCLKQHIKRVNYRSAQLKRSHINVFEMPLATGHAWVQDGEVLVPDWSDGPTIPDSLDELAQLSEESSDGNQLGSSSDNDDEDDDSDEVDSDEDDSDEDESSDSDYDVDVDDDDDDDDDIND